MGKKVKKSSNSYLSKAQKYFIRESAFDNISRYVPKKLDVGLLFDKKDVELFILKDVENYIINEMTTFRVENNNVLHIISTVKMGLSNFETTDIILKDNIKLVGGNIVINGNCKSSIKDLVIKYIYFLNFKKDYPGCIKNDEFVQSYLNDFILFPEAITTRYSSLASLPEFVIGVESLAELNDLMRNKDFGTNVNNNNKLPFKNFNVLFSLSHKFLVNCKEADNDEIKFLVYNADNKRLIFASNLILESESFAMAVYDEKYPKYFEGIIDKNESSIEICKTLIWNVMVMSYFIFNYSVKIEELETVVDVQDTESSNGESKYSKKKNNSTVILVPRKKYVLSRKHIIDSIKKKELERKFSKAEWERAGHYRVYRNEDGSVRKRVFIESTKCKRNPNLLDDVENNNQRKKYVFNANGIKKATQD